MKTDYSRSVSTSMSVELCSNKLRFLTLVIEVADLINERTTPCLTISHAVVAPTAIFSTVILLSIFVIGSARKRYASQFLQVYSLVACSSLQACLSIIVFKELRIPIITGKHAAMILNGVLPMLAILSIIADLVVIMFSSREEILPPSLSSESRPVSHLELR